MISYQYNVLHRGNASAKPAKLLTNINLHETDIKRLAVAYLHEKYHQSHYQRNTIGQNQ